MGYSLQLLFSLASLTQLSAAPAKEGAPNRYEFTQAEMGAPFTIILYAPDEGTANRAAKAAFARVQQLNSIMSDYDPNTELSRLSQSAPSAAPIHVSEDLWRVLLRSQQLAEQSDGAFDITAGPYIKLWRRARRSKEMPSAERLEEARAAVGYQHVKLDPEHHTAELLRSKMHLDLGGIAMGYTVDETFKVLRAHGITRALVDGSGDIGVGDPPPGKPGWKVAIAPADAAGKKGAPRYVLLSRAAITTSGDVFQHVVIGGSRYSHIVDPKTGFGLTDHSSVTVIAPDCITADSQATAVSVLGPQKGLDLIEQTPGAAAIITHLEGDRPTVYESERFKQLSFVSGE